MGRCFLFGKYKCRYASTEGEKNVQVPYISINTSVISGGS